VFEITDYLQLKFNKLGKKTTRLLFCNKI